MNNGGKELLPKKAVGGKEDKPSSSGARRQPVAFQQIRASTSAKVSTSSQHSLTDANQVGTTGLGSTGTGQVDTTGLGSSGTGQAD